MSHLSTHAKGAILDHLTGNATWVAPSNLYLALLKSAAADADTGTTLTADGHEITTPGQDGYARQEIAPGGGTLSAEGATVEGQSETTVQVSVGPFTANLDAATHWALVDATSGGNMWEHGALDSSPDPVISDSIVFPAGTIKLTAG